MSVLKITSENYEEEVLNSKEKVLIDFYADWCGPCKMMAPVVEEVANELEGKLKVGKVNVDENQDLAIKYGIMSIPTLVVIENGETLNNVEKIAKEKLGMQKLTNKQTVYVNLPKEDYVESASEEVVVQEEENWFEQILDKIFK